MKNLKHRFEFALVWILDTFLCSLPRAAAIRVGESLGDLMSMIIRKRHRLIIDNLAHALPEKSAAERERIARAVWRNIGRTAVEFLRMGQLGSEQLARESRCEGAEHLDRALRENTGVILLAAHFGNWEALGMIFQAKFGRFMAIARPMKNPYVEKWVQSKRTRGGMKIILHREAVKASLKWVKQGNIIGILIDQNLYTGGVFVDFFGRPAATTTLPALLHMRTGTPVMFSYVLREGDKFRAVISPPIQFPPVADEADRARVYTQIISNVMESVIRKYPENWFWIHNRWKRKPE